MNDLRQSITDPPRESSKIKVRKIKVILPAYNEEKTLLTLLDHLDFAFQEANLQSEIIVINDGSTDRTAEIAGQYQGLTPLKLINQSINRGLAETIKNGFFTLIKECGDEDIIIVMDADNTHTPSLIFRMVRLIREGCDVVIASRYHKESIAKGLSLSRSFLSWGASILFRSIVRINGVKDYTCAYRAYRAGFLRSAIQYYEQDFIQQTGFACMVEILLRIKKFDPIIREVPLILRYDYKESSSKMDTAKTIKETLGLLFNYVVKKKY